jgi:hypothetical protein
MTVSFVSSTKLPNYEFNWNGVGASGNLVKGTDFTVENV